MNSSLPQHLPPVVHVTVNTGIAPVLLAGLVGGATILLGVVVTEVLVRFRERRRELEAALWNMHLACGSQAAAETEAGKHVAEEAFTNSLAQMRSLAKWPIPNRTDIVSEIDAVFGRFAVGVARRMVEGTPLLLGAIRGTRITRLVMGDRDSVAAINSALVAAGYPTLDEWTNPDAWPERPEAMLPTSLWTRVWNWGRPRP